MTITWFCYYDSPDRVCHARLPDGCIVGTCRYTICCGWECWLSTGNYRCIGKGFTTRDEAHKFFEDNWQTIDAEDRLSG